MNEKVKKRAVEWPKESSTHHVAELVITDTSLGVLHLEIKHSYRVSDLNKNDESLCYCYQLQREEQMQSLPPPKKKKKGRREKQQKGQIELEH